LSKIVHVSGAEIVSGSPPNVGSGATPKSFFCSMKEFIWFAGLSCSLID